MKITRGPGIANCIKVAPVHITETMKMGGGGGGVYQHICAYCLTQGRQVAHPEKECKSMNKNGTKKSNLLSSLGFEPGQLCGW